MRDHPRILISTLYAGENELDECLESLHSQSYSNWEHKIYRHLPNKKAHDTLYRDFMNRSDEFDLFIKIDADMVFRNSEGLVKILDLFRDLPDLDHLEMAVHDWFSNSLIMGAHAYTSRAKWMFNDEDLFVDYNPVVPGRKLYVWNDPAPLLEHSPNPAPYQAFRFGIHRSLKAFQPTQKSFNRSHAKAHWKILKDVWNQFVATNDKRRGFAILGADLVIDGKIKQLHYDCSNLELSDIYQPHSRLSSEELYNLLRPRWGKPIHRELERTTRLWLRWTESYLIDITKRANMLIGKSSHRP